MSTPDASSSEDDARRVLRLSEPDTYAAERLGMRLHPVQAAVLRDWLLPAGRQSRVAWRCGNEVGKTSTVATAGILYSLEVLGAQVISTAGVWMQVVSQLVPQLRRYAHLFPSYRFLEASISIGGSDRYVGFSTRDEGFAQGFHRRPDMPLVAIIDEAAAVRDVIYDGVEDRCNPDYLLIMGSPLDPAGRFYDVETKLSKFYTHHHLPQTECLTTQGWWIDPATIERKIAKYGGKEHPFVQSNVFGNFSAKIENGLISLAEYEACVASSPQWYPGVEDRHLFVDVGVSNIAALRHGNKVSVEREWTGDNIPSICGNIIRIGSRLKQSIGLLPQEITVDGGGDYGKQVCDALIESGWPVNRWAGQAKASDHDYHNAISEAWVGGCGKIKSCDIILPNNDNFRAQCLSRKQRTSGTGKIQVEPKDEYIKRGFTSPHEGDAIFGCMRPIKGNKSVNLSGLNHEPMETRGWVEQARNIRQDDCVLPAESCL